jgi:RHS repeat-associated protein
LRYRPSIERLEQLVMLNGTVTWINAAGGDWDTAANWRDQNGVQRLPGPSDDAIINVPNNVAITHSQNVTDTVASLTLADPMTLSSGAIVVTGNLSSSSSFDLAGGTLSRADIQPGTTVTATGSGGVLDQVTLGGTIQIGASATVTGGLNLAAGSLLQIGNDQGFMGDVSLGGNETIDGPGEIRFVGGGGRIRCLGNEAFGNGLLVDGANGAIISNGGTLSNEATIDANTGSISLFFATTPTWQNAAGGVLEADGGTLNLMGTWSNSGQIMVTAAAGSTLDLGGSFTTAGLGSFANAGGAIDLTGFLDNTASTLALDATTGSWNLVGGTLHGGTVTTTGGSDLIGTGSGGTLDQVTLAGTLLNPGGAVAITGGLNLASGSLVQLGNDQGFVGDVSLGGNETIDGPGEIRFVGAGGRIRCLGNEAFGNGLLVDGANGAIISNGGTLSNEATIDANTGPISFFVATTPTWQNAAGGVLEADGGTLNLMGNWSNTGQIMVTASAGSTLELGGTFTTAGLGSYTRTGGTIYLTGYLDNTGSTLNLDAATGSWILSGGTLHGGTVTTSGGSSLTNTSSGGTLDGITLDGLVEATGRLAVTGGLTIASDGVFQVGDASGFFGDVLLTSDETIGGSGEIRFVGQRSFGLASRLQINANVTFAPGLTVEGTDGDLLINGTLTNEGTIAFPSGTLNITGSGSWVNAGTINTPNSTDTFGATFSFAQGSTFTASGGYVMVTGTLDNTGQTLTLDGTKGIFGIADGGTILGGTVATLNGDSLYGTTRGVIDGITLRGLLQVNRGDVGPGNVTVLDNLTLDGGVVQINQGSTLDFKGTQTLGGTGSVVFDNTAANTLSVGTAGTTLTIAPGVTIHGIAGTIDATGASLVNQGTIASDGGGTITVNAAANFANGTLTGGSWQASGGGTLLLSGVNIATDAANVLVSGAGSHITSDASNTDALGALASVAADGTLTFQAGAQESTSATEFSNTGLVTVGVGSSFTVAGTYSQSGGSTVVDGDLELGSSLAVNAGTLSGSGTVHGDVTNAAVVGPGDPVGVLTVTGNYTQTAAGTLNTGIGGTTLGSQYAQLNVQGNATLGGTLNINLVNGFGPALGQTFQILNFAAATGTFAAINGLQVGFRNIFTVNQTATNLTLDAVSNASDLAFTSMSIPASSTPGQNLTVSYTVTNLQETAATGEWYDSVYLSESPVFDTNAALLGRVDHVGDVAGGASYTESLTAPLPNLAIGNYHVFVLVDSRGQTSDLDRSNNTGVSSGTISVTVPTLTIGAAVSGTIASGQDIYYQLVIPPGGTISIMAQFAVSTEAEFYVRFGELPDRSDFDQTAPDLTALQPKLTIADAQGGNYYVLLHGREGAGAGQSFTLQADGATFGVSSFSPDQGSNTGDATVSLVGTLFTPQTAVTLTDINGNILATADVEFVDAQHLNATFHLQTDMVPVGDDNIRVTDHGQTMTAGSVFRVTAGVPGALDITILSPQYVRVGAAVNVTLNLMNSNNGDTTAPLIVVQATGVDASETNRQFFATSPDQLPGVLPGDYTGGIGISYNPQPHANGAVSNFDLSFANPSDTPVDWDSMKEMYRPSYVSEAAWDAVWSIFRTQVGNTLSDFYQLLQNDSEQLARIGDFDDDIGDLVQFEIEKAADDYPSIPVVSPTVDLSLPAPGFPLTFTRSFGASIYDRYRTGRLGTGWVDNWDISASTDSNGLTIVREGSELHFFGQDSNGKYIGFPGETGTLTSVNGALQLRQTDGSLIVFRPDGLLDYVEDANHNRVTAGYSGTQLTSLSDSDGDSLSLSYNAQGLVSQVADSTGRVVTYTYDSNEQMTSATTVAGTTAYGYTADASGPRAHALTSITFPAGDHLFFSYDAQGHLSGEQRDGGAEPLTFTYGVDDYSVTDALGNTTVTYFDVMGRPVASSDPLNRTAQVAYDNSNNPVSIGTSTGGFGTLSYDANGNPLTQVDPLGETQSYTYDSTFNQLTSWTDAQGNTTAFAIDANGNTTQATYADGSAQQFGYDAQGNITDTVTRAGQSITYTYDSRGLLLQQTFADGTHDEYKYDAHGNMISATDATGTTTLAYDSADRLTMITYPSGRSLRYSYDGDGRRTQMVDQDGFTVNYTYDAVGRLAGLTDGSGNPIVTYSYDAAGQLTREDYGNGTYTTYGYDAAGELIHLIDYAPDNSVQSRFDYTYDSLGRVASETTLDGTTTYGYDGIGRLTSATLPGGQVITYQYDAEGNRTSATDNGAATAYTTNNLNEYTSVGGASNSYDQNGNLIAGAGPQGDASYTYDVQGRLASVTTSAGTWAYQYDVFGNRISTTHNGQTTNYLIDPDGTNSVVGEYDSAGNLIAHYTQGLGLASRVDASGQSAYYDFDASGNTTQLTGAGGAVLNTYQYLPFGETLASSQTVANPFTFNGQLGVASESNGLYFMGQRYYDPSAGRFIQPDPLGLSGGTNSYAFAANNPESLADPTGLNPVIFAATWGATLLILPAPVAVPAAAAISPLATTLGPGAVAAGAGGSAADLALADTVQFVNAAFRVPVGSYVGGVSQADAALALSRVAGGGGAPATAAPGAAVAGPLAEATLLASAFVLGGIAVWGAGSLAYAQAYGHIYHDVPACPSFFPKGLNTITACVGPSYSLSFKGHTTTTQENGSHDPNAISGPGGFGSSNFIAADSLLPYEIYFQNEATATGPAAQVVITEQLDSNLDWSTFELGDFGFGGVDVQVPSGRSVYHTRLDERAKLGVFVDVSAGLDPTTGIVTWTFTALDPKTLDIPADPTVGFLPPDDSNGDGEGFAAYFVRPKQTLTSGLKINAQATVVFDTNAPINTPQFQNTVDAGAPASTVSPLAGASPPSFTVNWSGQDDAGGSGIAYYNVYVSDDGGPYTLWQDESTATSAVYNGQNGHNYSFYSVATDNVGNVQPTLAAAQASTTVAQVAETMTSVVSSAPATTYGQALTFTATVSEAVPGTPTPTGTVQFVIDGSNFGPPVALSGDTATSPGTTTLGAGNHTIQAVYSGDSQNLGSDGNYTQVVNQAALSILPDTQTRQVGQPNPTLTYQLAGFVNGENAITAGVTGAADLTTPATVGSPAGGYAITVVDPGTLSAANYAFPAAGFGTGTLTVTPGSTSLQVGSSLAAATYGQLMTFTAAVSGGGPEPTGTVQFVVDGTNLGAPQSLDSDGTASMPEASILSAGNHTIQELYSGDSNYAANTASFTEVIQQAPLTVVADDQSMNHYDAVPTLTFHYTGFVGSDTATNSGIVASITPSTTATSSSPAGYYPIVPTVNSFSAPNYTIGTIQNGTLTVKPKVMDVRVDFGSTSMSLIGLTRDLPFINIKALDVIFSDNVNVSSSMLQLTGMNVSNYSFSNFNYNAKTDDATWSLPSAIGVDRLMLSLSGETAPPSSGSGSNIAANPFSNPFAVLPGDVNGDGVVSGVDATTVNNQIHEGYLIWDDVTGDGVIDITDVTEVRKQIGKHLP